MPTDPVVEDVPKFLGRDGDVIQEGRNNALIVIGRDRIDGIDSGYGSEEGAGAITMVVGRASEDLDLAEDSATVMLSMKSQPDPSVGTQLDDPKSVAVVRADRILLVPREELVIKVGRATLTMTSSGKIVIDGDIELGKGAVQRAIKESFVSVTYPLHTHATPAGTSGPPNEQVPDGDLSDVVRLR